MVLGAEGTVGNGAGAGLLGRDTALAAAGIAALTEEVGEDLETALVTDFNAGLRTGFPTGFITDLATGFV